MKQEKKKQKKQTPVSTYLNMKYFFLIYFYRQENLSSRPQHNAKVFFFKTYWEVYHHSIWWNQNQH